MKKRIFACSLLLLMCSFICVGIYKYSKTEAYIFISNNMMYAEYNGKIYYEQRSITPEIFTNQELFQNNRFQLPPKYSHSDFCDNLKIYAVEAARESKRFYAKDYVFAKQIHISTHDSDCFYVENNQVFGPPSWIFYCEDFQLPAIETNDVEAIRLDYSDTSVLITNSDQIKALVERIKNEEDFIDLIENTAFLSENKIKIFIIYANSSLNEFIGIIENGIMYYDN